MLRIVMRLNFVFFLVLVVAVESSPLSASNSNSPQTLMAARRLIRICQTDAILCEAILKTQNIQLTRREINDSQMEEKPDDEELGSASSESLTGDVGTYNRRIPRIGKYMRFGRRGGDHGPLATTTTNDSAAAERPVYEGGQGVNSALLGPGGVHSINDDGDDENRRYLRLIKNLMSSERGHPAI